MVVAGATGPVLTGFLERVATALDVPLVPVTELAGPAEVEALAAFDGWVTTAAPEGALAELVERADLVVVLLNEEPGSFRGRVRRTVRRMRADAPAELDLAWFDALALTRPELATVRLVGNPAIEAWVSDCC
ncbi:hypothetical protein ASE01_10345 [Nocardioides sp. Root190]|nr:hypothetical protein ASE01_10345 [Nocardioides sp. Root190]